LLDNRSGHPLELQQAIDMPVHNFEKDADPTLIEGASLAVVAVTTNSTSNRP